MSRAQHTAVEMRRERLLARSHALRHRLAVQSQALQRPLAVADQARSGFAWLKAHPQWVLAIVAVPVLLRPRRALGWALKLWWGWRLMQRIRSSLPP
jgi:hypothetical protein